MRSRQFAALLVFGAVLGCGQTTAPAGGAGGGNPGEGNPGEGNPGGGGVGGGGAGGSGAGDAGTGGHPTAGGNGGNATAPAAFQYDGSIAFASGVVVTPQRVEISAPILPRTTVIYAPFPTTLDGEKAMAHDAALLFDWLLQQCAPLYPKITLAPSDGTALAPTQLAVNYDEVGRCAYEQYVAKPYWIPKLVNDVDICGTEMGSGWRLITEADLTSLAEADFQNVADTWNLQAIGSTGLGFFFSSLAIWVRAGDGTIAAGTLAPGVTGSRVTPLGVDPSSTTHYEGSLGLRCIRMTDPP